MSTTFEVRILAARPSLILETRRETVPGGRESGLGHSGSCMTRDQTFSAEIGSVGKDVSLSRKKCEFDSRYLCQVSSTLNLQPLGAM